ncbi:MAG: ribose-5-phosphate isomerase RpiA [Janthinobacterium lividum]
MPDSSAQQAAKLAAAKAALRFIEPGMTVGLGSGTTATLFIQLLGEQVKQGLKIRGIASSDDSEKLARSLGIPITDFSHHKVIDVAVDGADEVGPGMALIKGGGGKLLREKIVASASARFIVVADESKLVDELGAFPLPVEVITMAVPLVVAQLEQLGFQPKIRQSKTGPGPYITDEGNILLDCSSAGIVDPEDTAAEIRAMVGVVEHGLFLGMAERALIAGVDGVRELTVKDLS